MTKADTREKGEKHASENAQTNPTLRQITLSQLKYHRSEEEAVGKRSKQIG
ncbi:hypothetical protein M5D96_005964 [Drosophila gunungcola]|uniref:Uncharacterized protein n=1 Tax=Drosophila gunungcola TaxID=103775 RepID=A0A9P9YRR3_9MUSC|nr:hypothetical protein M5D96_005964 [Drosophila gunungcola]